MYYVYILQSRLDCSYYTGLTQNLQSRIRKHNNKEVAYSRKKAPYKLVWFSVFPNKTKASAFERYLKRGSGHAFARKRLV